MALGCGAKFFKYCLFGFNLIFVIAGVVCLGVGVWLIADNDRAMDSIDSAMQQIKVDVHQTAVSYKGMPNAVRNLGIILAATGAVILVVSFLGCCGAVKEWRPMLILYAIFLFVILAAEIAVAAYMAVNRDEFENNAKTFLAESLRAYGGNDSSPNVVRSTWDQYMNKSQCCGVDPHYGDGQHGFQWSAWYGELRDKCGANQTALGRPYPLYCCSVKSPPTLQTCNGYRYCYGEQAVYQSGCFDKLRASIQQKISAIIGVGVAVGLIQLVGIVFACCLCCAIAQEA